MDIYFKNKIFIAILLYELILILFSPSYLFTSIDDFDEISVVINMKNLTKDKHIFFYEIMKDLNSTRNFYFIKTSGKSLLDNLNDLVENKSVKIIQSNFPDSIFLPLVVSLYGNNVPKLVLFIEGEEFLNINGNELVKWARIAINEINMKNYDYIFGNSQFIKEKQIGCSLLLSKSSIIQHLLYYTDSDTTHANPFLQLSLSTQATFRFLQFNNSFKFSALENINNKISQNILCPSIADKSFPSLGIMIPAFKRDYFSNSFKSFSKQTFKPKFYIIIQNDNIKHFNLTNIQNMVNEPVYHIWMQNWNSFFFLNLRLSSILPCDFILKYDDDQWPNDIHLNEYLINSIRNKNIILGLRGFAIDKPVCGYSPKFYKNIEKDIQDHTAVPELIRRGYLKLDARNKIFRLYGLEDVALSVNSYLLCNATSKIIKMNLIEKQNDGNSQAIDNQIVSSMKKEKIYNFDFFMSSYCFFIHSGYIPRKWDEFRIPQKDYINISIAHKRLF